MIPSELNNNGNKERYKQIPGQDKSRNLSDTNNGISWNIYLNPVYVDKWQKVDFRDMSYGRNYC